MLFIPEYDRPFHEMVKSLKNIPKDGERAKSNQWVGWVFLYQMVDVKLHFQDKLFNNEVWAPTLFGCQSIIHNEVNNSRFVISILQTEFLSLCIDLWSQIIILNSCFNYHSPIIWIIQCNSRFSMIENILHHSLFLVAF